MRERFTALSDAALQARWPSLDADHAWYALWQGYYSYWRDNGRFPEEERPRQRPAKSRPQRQRAPRSAGDIG